MTDIADYAVLEVVIEHDRFVLYRARDARGADVLLKVTRAGVTPEQLSALSSDFLAARRCDIPAIPRPLRIETLVTGGSFQVRQYVPGRPLALWSKSGRTRPPAAESLQIVLLLLAALEPLHIRGFVHCDMDPRTLLYDPEGGALYFADCASTRGYGAVTRRTDGPSSPYLAPEQMLGDTGQLDARADLYGVGVIAHELLTGELPPEDGFPTTPPPGVPAAFAPVIARLLARDREQRHATAAAASRDLRRALDLWRGVAVSPAPAEPDEAPGTVRLPDALFGRQEVRTALADALLDASGGNPTLVLLTGEGGSGKSTVLADLRRSALQSNAVVLVGGWGLFDGEIPFRGLFPLCEQIVEWLSTLSEAERRERVLALRTTLGDGCGVVTEAFPVLEAVLGIHPKPPTTGTIERQNRLTYCFTTLLGALGSPERPVVVLLEDLHWADGASLFMLERLPGRARAQHLLTVATIRTGLDGANDGFVSELVATSAERGQSVRRLAVSPFEQGDTESFLAGALGMLPEATSTLAAVLTEMSLGNPLAVRELLAEIKSQGLLSFDPLADRWVWQTEAIRRSHIPEDLAQIFASRISSLPALALQVLRAAACVGGRFHAGLVAELLELPSAVVAESLAMCAAAGFITRRDAGASAESFEFRHARIQSAAYGGASETLQKRFHAARGAALLAEHEASGAPEALFEALSHLNRSHSLGDRQRDPKLAELNFRAALRAKEATAYETAAQLLQNVQAQLAPEDWNSDPRSAFDYALLRAECEHLCKRSAAAAEIYADLLKRTVGPEQRITVLMARTQMLTNLGRFRETVADGVASLALLGLKLPLEPTRGQVILPALRILALHRRLPANGTTVSLVELDPVTAQIMACLAELWGPAFWVSENLTGLVVFAMVKLSLTHGNTAASSIGYCSYGVFLSTAMKRHELGKDVCRLGVSIAERASSPVYLGRARFMYESFFGPDEDALQEAPRRFREIAAGLLRAGDYSYAGAAANMFLYYVAVVGTPLADFPNHVRDIVGVARQIDQSRTLLTVEILERWIAVLDGREEYGPPRFLYDVTAAEGRGSENERGVFNLFEISLLYLLENYRAAAPHIAFMPGNRMLGGYFAWYYEFFKALVLAKQRNEAGRDWLKQFGRIRRSLERQSARSPRNYRHKARLLAAIEADARGDHPSAARAFEDAIADASRHGFLPNAAIAAELFAEHLERRGETGAAERQLRAARLWYHEWGCLVKVGAIDRRLPKSLPSVPPKSEISVEADAWPRQAGPVLEAARVLSGETDPSRVAERLISSIFEHTRATRVVLLTREHDALAIACERRAAVPEAAPGTRGGDDLPQTILHYVDRLGRALRLRASVEHELFGRDPYMASHTGAALLCVPLMHMRQKIGVLFLEKEAPGTLSQSDLVTAEILAAQAAATISNAREYNERLAALQNQMHPHFLFNALSGIAELTLADPQRAERAILGLATLYRSILATSQRRAIPLRQELELVESYLGLEKLRFGERLSYGCDVRGDAGAVLVPPLVLQPLVENSVNHGIARQPRGGKVGIEVAVGKDRVHVRVSDDGAGLSAGGSGRGAGLGITSIRRRLELFFGSEVDLIIKSTDGVTVDLFFPARRDEHVV